MECNIEAASAVEDRRRVIRQMFVDGKIDANAATCQLLTLDSQRRGSRAGIDDAPAAGRD